MTSSFTAPNVSSNIIFKFSLKVEDNRNAVSTPSIVSVTVKALSISASYNQRNISANFSVLNSRGVALSKLNNFSGAIQYYDKALDIDPNNKVILYNKANALIKLADYAKAIDYLDRVLALDPNYINALNDKGVALGGLGNYSGAIQYYDKALDIDRTFKEAIKNKEVALNNMNNYTQVLMPDVAEH